MALLNFDATGVAAPRSFAPIPVGPYEAEIIESEFKDTKKGDGKYLQLTFAVISGDHAGRRLWARLNLKNPNETAVEIAQSELGAICHAVGLLQVGDSEELHNRPMTVHVGMEKDQNGEPTNRIRGFDPINPEGPKAFAETAAAPAKAAFGKPAAAPAAASKVPWKK